MKNKKVQIDSDILEMLGCDEEQAGWIIEGLIENEKNRLTQRHTFAHFMNCNGKALTKNAQSINYHQQRNACVGTRSGAVYRR